MRGWWRVQRILKKLAKPKQALRSIIAYASAPSYRKLSAPVKLQDLPEFKGWPGRIKVAICFSGQIRSLDKGFEHINKYLLEPNRQTCNIDIFVHCWFDPSEVGKSFVAASGVLVKSPLKETSLEDIERYYKPKKLLAEKQIIFDEKDYNDRKPDLIVPFYSLSKNYSLKKSIELKKQYEAKNNFVYDLVMTLRFDLGINRPILFKNFNPEILTTSDQGVTKGEGVDVTHSIMGSKISDIYATFFDHMDEYYREGIRFCDEPMMHRHLDVNHIPFIRMPELSDYTFLR